jgi:acyl carrier protein
MKEKIISILEKELPPTVNLSSNFLFSELDSLSITLILTVLSDEFGIELDSTDATPNNFMSVDSITHLVESKLQSK